MDDWVVLHGGATAVVRVGSLSEAAHMADAVAKAPGIAGAGVLLTLDDRVTIRLTRDIWTLESGRIELARNCVKPDRQRVPTQASRGAVFVG